MRKIFLSALTALISFGVQAQSDFLVNTKADTLKGTIRILSYDKLDRVQINISGKKEVLTAFEILTLQINEETYKPIRYDNSVRLMKVLKTGYLSLLAFRLPNQSTYDGRYLLKMDGSGIEMPNISFKKIMAGYLEDCAEIAEKIKKGELGKSRINEIIDSYNACVIQANSMPVVVNTPQADAIQALLGKINELNFDTKQDALDILKDIQSKVSNNEKVSKYLIDGLENALKDQPSLTAEVKTLIDSLKN